MSHGFYCFRFGSSEDRDRVLLVGPWIALSPWPLRFLPSADTPTRVVLWMCLPDLPHPLSLLWHLPILELILVRAGRLLRLDTSTELLMKGQFPKVAVEVDLSQLIVPDTVVTAADEQFESFWQPFEYDNLPLLCFRCGRIGHCSAACPFANSSSVQSPLAKQSTPPTPASELTTTEAADNPWMHVRPRHRQNCHYAPPVSSAPHLRPPRTRLHSLVLKTLNHSAPCLIPGHGN